MSDYKSQHTITKAYLRGFTAESSPTTLWRYDKTAGSVAKKSVDKATVKLYAYSFREPDGSWNHQVEHILGEIESNALPLLPKVEIGAALSEGEKYAFALFIGMLIRRPSALLEHFENEIISYAGNRKLQLALVEGMLPELKQRFSEEEIQSAFEAVRDGKFDVPFDTAKANQMQVWLNSMPKYANTIADMHWQIWKADRQIYFLTSDAPAFVRRHAHDDDVGVVGITRADLNAELTFPITKKSLLIAKHEPCKSIQRATKTRVRELNSLIVRMANKHVFAPQLSRH